MHPALVQNYIKYQNGCHIINEGNITKSQKFKITKSNTKVILERYYAFIFLWVVSHKQQTWQTRKSTENYLFKLNKVTMWEEAIKEGEGNLFALALCAISWNLLVFISAHTLLPNVLFVSFWCASMWKRLTDIDKITKGVSVR